ncbi:MAG: cation:proton antiporter [Inquilinus sp.]|nr:cation:proton antiporter [Inquilinus sp.]
MPDYLVLLTVGALLLMALVVDVLGERTRLPRVTLLVLVGMAAGPSGFDVLPIAFNGWYPLFAIIALVMVAFLLGGRLTRQVLAEDGLHILGVSTGAVLVTAVLVGGGLWLLGFEPILCLVLAGISTATAPAATQDVVHRSRVTGPFARLLLGVVAIDDAWGLIVFSLLLAAGQALLGQSPAAALQIGAWEIGGALLVGLAVGLPAAYLTGRLQPGEPTQIEALGVVFLCGGLALAIDASFLLAGMVAGLIVANLARHHTRPFHEIENVEWPFLVLFFVLAGASVDLAALPKIGAIGGAYLVLRAAGRIIGGWLGGAATGLAPRQRRWIGVALMPQAGVSLGMALVAATAFPAMRAEILATAIGTTIVFELVGPLMTQWALTRAGRNEDRAD